MIGINKRLFTRRMHQCFNKMQIKNSLYVPQILEINWLNLLKNFLLKYN